MADISKVLVDETEYDVKMNIPEMTKAEYDALSDEEKNDNRPRIITDRAVGAATAALQTAVDTQGILGEAGADTTSQLLFDGIAVKANDLDNTKQPKTLFSPITVNGISQTTVEGTLDALNTLAAGNKTNIGTLSNLKTLNKTSVVEAVNELEAWRLHNIPRAVPKDITSYYKDGSLWSRLAGTNGYSKYEDVFCGDYFQMSRAISAKNKDTSQQATGSQYVTIAGISCMMQNGDTAINYEHLVMVPGQGFGGTQHFGKSRMNATNVTTGGIVGSEMFTDILGAAATSGSTASGATINQQLYAEFGSHLKTTREWITNAVDTAKYNRFGTNSGCATSSAWTSVQAILMSEAEVYGATIFGSSAFDSAMNSYQLPLFTHSKLAANNRSSSYWLRDVASASRFCRCHYLGIAHYDGASFASTAVRPRFVIA